MPDFGNSIQQDRLLRPALLRHTMHMYCTVEYCTYWNTMAVSATVDATLSSFPETVLGPLFMIMSMLQACYSTLQTGL